MEEVWKKTRLSIFIGFGIVFMELLLGFTLLSTGLLFTEYDSKSALEMMAVIQDTNPQYYAMLNDSTDYSQKAEFDRLYTKKGNRGLSNYGIVSIFLAFVTLIPFAQLYMNLNVPGSNKPKNKEKKEGKKKESKEKTAEKNEADDSF